MIDGGLSFVGNKVGWVSDERLDINMEQCNNVKEGFKQGVSSCLTLDINKNPILDTMDSTVTDFWDFFTGNMTYEEQIEYTTGAVDVAGMCFGGVKAGSKVMSKAPFGGKGFLDDISANSVTKNNGIDIESKDVVQNNKGVGDKTSNLNQNIDNKLKNGVGITGEGIPLKEVKIETLKQIYPDNNAAYGYLPKEGTPYYTPKYNFRDVDWARDMQNIRKEYIAASKQLEIDIEKMITEGVPKKEIANHVVDVRNQQKVEARSNMSKEELDVLEQRNIEIYGNAVGPNSQWLFNKNKKKLIKEGTYIDDEQVWNIVIKNSMKKDDVINTLLGLMH